MPATAKISRKIRKLQAAVPPVKAPAPTAPIAKAAPETAAKQAAVNATVAKREADRNTVAAVYDGASLTVHGRKAGKRSDYAARVLHPVQRAASPSTRDESLLALIARNADKAGTFDPVSLACDLGVISRLASLGLVTYAAKNDTFAATEPALALGRNAAKRA